MARKTKYDTHIKPFLADIKKLAESGASEKFIYSTIGVSHDLWIRAKKEHIELSESLNTKVKIQEALKEGQNLLDGIPEEKDWVAKMYEKAWADDASFDVFMKTYRQLFPKSNHYLQLEFEKLKIEKEKIDSGIGDTKVVIQNDTIKINQD